MIKEVQSCVFEQFEKIENCGLVHQCNCFCVMGAGVAKEVKKRYPSAYRADCMYSFAGDETKLGDFSVSRAGADLNKRFVFNVYGQYGYGLGGGQNTEYHALRKGLEGVKAFCNKHQITKLCIPYNIGCGLGGGNWKIVSGIIEDVFGNSDMEAFICQKH